MDSTPNEFSAPSSQVSFGSRLKNFSRTHKRLSLLIGLLLAIGGFSASIYLGNLPTANPSSPTETEEDFNNTFLFVAKIDPEGRSGVPDQITVTFNDEVDPEALMHYFYISPRVEGEFKKGTGINQIDFVPKSPLARSIRYSIKIAQGLTSVNNKLLINDFTSSFDTELAANEVRFVKDNFAGRLLSFASDANSSLTVIKSTNLAKVKVSLYRSDEKKLLKYLTWRSEKRTSDNYEYTVESFIEDAVDHTGADLIKDFEVAGAEETKIDVGVNSGLYYLEAKSVKDDRLVGSAYLNFNNLGMTLRQDDKKVVLSSFNIKTGRKLEDTIDVAFYSLKDAVKPTGTQKLAGLGSYSYDFSKSLDLVLGRAKGELIVVPVKLPDSQADLQVSSDLDQTHQTFIYTDRPIYQPKDKVKFRGVVRQDSDGLYQVAAGKRVRVWLDYGDKPEFETTVTTNQYGVFRGEFDLPKGLDSSSENLENFTHYLYASTNLQKKDNYSSDSAYFDVISYTKPDFEIKTEVDRSEIVKNELLKFTIKANRFDGSPLKNQAVKYTVYTDNYYETERKVYNSNFNINSFGGMCGGGLSAFEEWYGTEVDKDVSVQLDSSGKTEVAFDSKKLKERASQKITLVATRTDQNGNEIVSATSVIVHAGAYNLFYIPSADSYQSGEEVVAPFYAESLKGDKITDREIEFRLIEPVYDQKGTQEKVVAKGKTKTDGSGKGIIKFKLPTGADDRAYYLIAQGQDDQGNPIENEKYIYIRPSQAQKEQSFWSRDTISQTYLKITSDQNSFIVGEEINLTVKSPKELDVLLTLERGRVYEPQYLHLVPGDNYVAVEVTEEASPSITAVFSFFADGQYHTEGLALNVPAMHKLLTVTAEADKGRYAPGENAKIKIQTKDAAGRPVSAQLSLGVIDKAIYGLRKSATPPAHSSFYYFRPRSTNASSSLTWVGQFQGGGGGGGGGGGSQAGKTVDTLYWNPDLATDTTGETVVTVPLGQTKTTWKAQVIGSTAKSEFGQTDTEFVVTE